MKLIDFLARVNGPKRMESRLYAELLESGILHEVPHVEAEGILYLRLEEGLFGIPVDLEMDDAGNLQGVIDTWVLWPVTDSTLVQQLADRFRQEAINAVLRYSQLNSMVDGKLPPLTITQQAAL